MPGLPLEPTGEQVRALTEGALGYLVSFHNGLGEAAAANFDGVDELARVRHPAPERGRPFAELSAPDRKFARDHAAS